MSSDDINLYVKEVLGGEVSAKDFRTWHGTVLAAVALAERASDTGSRTARTRAVRHAMKDVAAYLGDTRAVARKSYIDPRLVDLFDAGPTIARALQRIAQIDGEAGRRRIEAPSCGCSRSARRAGLSTGKGYPCRWPPGAREGVQQHAHAHQAADRRDEVGGPVEEVEVVESPRASRPPSSSTPRSARSC